MKLSIVIPVRNEEQSIKKIIDELQSKLKNLPHEIIFINDFSTDNTLGAIKEFISQGYRTKDISTTEEYVKTSEVASILIGILKNG